MPDASKAKFQNKAAERLYVKFSADETIEVGNGQGWLGLYLVPGRGGAILHEDSMGFVSIDRHSSESSLHTAWEEAKDQFEPNPDEPEDEDYVLTDRPGGYFVNQGIGERETFRSCLVAIEADMKAHQFFPNLWMCDERGNFHLLNLAEQLASSDQEEDEDEAG